MSSFPASQTTPRRLPSFVWFDGKSGHLAYLTSKGEVREYVTLEAQPGGVIYLDLGHGAIDELCRDGPATGPTLIWSSDPATMGEALAADYGAKFCADRLEFEDAVLELHGGPKPDLSNVVTLGRR